MNSSIQAGVCGPSVWVKVEGKGSFLNSDNLKEFACEMLGHGYREFVVDLASCVTMDSTFMGTMARLALRLRDGTRTSPHHSLRKSQPTTFQGWVWTGYSILMLMAAVRQTVALLNKPFWRNRLRSEKTQTKSMLEAHEALCEAAPQNVLRFKDVLDFLRQELHYETPLK